MHGFTTTFVALVALATSALGSPIEQRQIDYATVQVAATPELNNGGPPPAKNNYVVQLNRLYNEDSESFPRTHMPPGL